MWKDDPGVYQIKCIINNKIYIGSSMRIKERWSRHKSNLRRGYHSNKVLQRDWNNYGEENFEFSVLERCPIEKLHAYEQKYLDELQPFLDNERGYNKLHFTTMAKYQTL
jgi:group I intron endonuclease